MNTEYMGINHAIVHGGGGGGCVTARWSSSLNSGKRAPRAAAVPVSTSEPVLFISLLPTFNVCSINCGDLMTVNLRSPPNVRLCGCAQNGDKYMCLMKSNSQACSLYTHTHKHAASTCTPILTSMQLVHPYSQACS